MWGLLDLASPSLEILQRQARGRKGRGSMGPLGNLDRGRASKKREYQIYIFTLSCCIPFPALLISTAAGLLLLLLATEGPGARTIVSGRIRRPGTEIGGDSWRYVENVGQRWR